ncbi:MAG: hypothetical protein A2350_05450 [Candidatus Raymondbacteria bacterium RifOxyB12_full_50_8]|uniref:Amidohydrolase-related domain-containing protein n=1 Tax=Candidatus Raymondbacteria bacterium RIFOXYD12_FULL_49_13 TaxID=1817890 RepID=A0A1F7FHQ7_UNCRA|nr:MAG: hypothetical protein A2248_20885 [Candidatus Raymondbacteria bacterium RIFOXYA2_FULL_49_16]OGJ99516.1 MAG: hypothetical protein A2350_05450 [Candidatus Raymondbacteria bacterium RifOxyB12_full_50_8]OGK06245.1 MAG: hypothetical protein A2519_08200 [Candidatus Raymondbacteria bacterium RIFOXYD12_FULL_49_13]OGP40577.1 MAG: hypothetical protein A2324_02955 [Candidatus Raymondbacteria bacterium RIFOXYB2_FULL_49_35]
MAGGKKTMLDEIAGNFLAGKRLDSVYVFDAHAHIGSLNKYAMPDSNADAMIKAMDRTGIDMAAISGIAAVIGGDVRFGNDTCIDAVNRFSGRFFGYITVDPYNNSDIIGEIKRCEKAGLRAYKIINKTTIKPYDAKEYRPAYEYANAKGYPVLVHTWGMDDLIPLRTLASEYTNIKWIAAHAGCIDEEEYAQLAKEMGNVYLEICLAIPRKGLIEYFVEVAGARKVLYGSDMAALSGTMQLGRVAFAKITKAEKEMIFGENSRRIMGI